MDLFRFTSKDIYCSREGESKIKTTREKFGLSDAHILPVINYTDIESYPDNIKSFLALQALENILHQALSFIEDNIP